MKTVLICGLISLALTVAAGAIAIPVLAKLKAGQPVLGYVKTHEEKNGTPTMGGLFFITVAALVFFLSGGGKSRVATVSVTFGLAFLAVGFLDDYLKVKFRKNEGLKAYQKIIFQAAIALVAVFCGAVNCPIASIILSVELFGSGELLYFALACGISYMLSGYFGLYSSQKIMYSKTRAEFINRYAK